MNPAYQTVFHLSFAGLVILERLSPDTFIIVDVNHAASMAASWDWSKQDDIVGQNITDVFQGVREHGLLDAYNRVLDTGESIELGEFEYEDPEVPYGIFNIELSPLSENQLLISFVNISKRKQTEEAFHERGRRLQLALDAAEVSTWHLDLVKNRNEWDARSLEIFG